MTKEELIIANNTWDEVIRQRTKVSELEHLIKNRHNLLFMMSNSGATSTYFSEDEIVFLEELLKYRKQELISLEKEFANL